MYTDNVKANARAENLMVDLIYYERVVSFCDCVVACHRFRIGSEMMPRTGSVRMRTRQVTQSKANTLWLTTHLLRINKLHLCRLHTLYTFIYERV